MISIRNEVSLPRLDADGNQISKRPVSLHPEGINLLDCLDNQSIRLPLQLDAFEANAIVQVWASLAGHDCRDATSRAGSNQTCWRLVEGVPLQPTVDVDIPVRSIIAGSAPFAPASPASGSDMCGAVDRVAIAVQVLYFAPGAPATAAEVRTVRIDADTRGPERPAAARVERDADPSIVRVSSDVPTDDGGVRIYCKKLEDQPADVCPSMAYGIPLAGYRVDSEFESSYACDDGVPSEAASTILHSTGQRRFEDGGRYAFLLTHVDSFANASTVSDAACTTLEAVAPAPADEGGCNAAGHDPVPSAFVFAALVLGAVVRRRVFT